MNTLLTYYLIAVNSDIWPAHSGEAGFKGLLISFLLMCIVIGVIAGLLYLIETYINKGPFPTPVRLVIGLVCVILVLIWAFSVF